MVSASAAVCRCSAPRSVLSRTQVASSRPRETVCGSKPSMRACSERYGAVGSWPCRPTRWSATTSGVEAGALEEVLPEQEGAVELPCREPHVTVKVLVSSVGPPPSPPDGSSVIATKV